MKKIIGIVSVILVLSGCVAQQSLTTTQPNKDGSYYQTINWEQHISDDDFDAIVDKRETDLPKDYDTEHIEGEIQNFSDPYQLDDTHYKRLTPDESLQLIEDKESAVVYFGWESCIYCYRLRQTFDFVLADLNQDIYEVEIEDLNEAEDELRQGVLNKYNVAGTPTIVVIKDGKEIDRLSNELQGTLDYVDLLEWVNTSIKEVANIE